jgi:predicted translation initiation factor SUI1
MSPLAPETQIKEALISLLDSIKRGDGEVLSSAMSRLDALLASERRSLAPQLAHFLERRSYAKALALLEAGSAQASRGRVDIRRETGGRGGKTVTVVTGFTGIGPPEKEQLAKRMRAACGCGGTVKEGNIEIQGDHREKIARILADAGFRPVMAGG